MVVNKFNVGDGIVLYGWKGIVIDKDTQIRDGDRCTYLKVSFNDPKEVGYQYEGGWYGGKNDVVAYGYYKR